MEQTVQQTWTSIGEREVSFFEGGATVWRWTELEVMIQRQPRGPEKRSYRFASGGAVAVDRIRF